MIKNQIFILIGGTGFIGENLLLFLSNAGKDVIVIGRKHGYVTIANETYYKSVEDAEVSILKAHNANADYVIIDLAYTSVPNASFNEPVKDFSENLLNIIKHLNFAKAINANKFIYISSGGTVYGEVDDDIISEDAANFPLSPYGITKMACERYVHLYNKTQGLYTCILRPSNIYGPGQKPFRGQGFIATVIGFGYQGNPITVYGDGSNVRDYIYVHDFCEAVLDTVNYGTNGGIYNIGQGVGHKNVEVIDEIDTILGEEGITLKRNYLPARPFDVQQNILGINKISALNGWIPKTSFNEGLRITASWVKKYIQSLN